MGCQAWLRISVLPEISKSKRLPILAETSMQQSWVKRRHCLLGFRRLLEADRRASASTLFESWVALLCRSAGVCQMDVIAGSGNQCWFWIVSRERGKNVVRSWAKWYKIVAKEWQYSAEAGWTTTSRWAGRAYEQGALTRHLLHQCTTYDRHVSTSSTISCTGTCLAKHFQWKYEPNIPAFVAKTYPQCMHLLPSAHSWPHK